jgi:hypothetical protein
MNMAGDSLARGAKSATFGPAKSVSQDKWDAAFEDFDPEEFLKKPNPVLETDPKAERSLVQTGIK